jgi:hypothetical protein
LFSLGGLLVHNRQQQAITIVGPTRHDPSWQTIVEGVYGRYQFKVNWEKDKFIVLKVNVQYRGLAKTHLQHLATAAAINLDRLVAWFDNIPRRQTRTSRFAALAPS